MNDEAEFESEGWAGNVSAWPSEHIMHRPVLNLIFSLQSDVENGKSIGWHEDVLKYHGLHPVEIDSLEVAGATLEPPLRIRNRTSNIVMIGGKARRTYEDPVVGVQIHIRVDAYEQRWMRDGLKLPSDGKIGPGALDNGRVRRVVVPGEQEPDVRVFPVVEVKAAAAAAIAVFPACPTVPTPDMRIEQGA